MKLNSGTGVPLTPYATGEYHNTMPMRKTAIFLPEDQSEKLQLLVELTGAAMSELIRRAIEAYLETRADEVAEARKARKARNK